MVHWQHKTLDTDSFKSKRQKFKTKGGKMNINVCDCRSWKTTVGSNSAVQQSIVPL